LVKFGQWIEGSGWTAGSFAGSSAVASGGLAATSRNGNNVQVFWTTPSGGIGNAFQYAGGAFTVASVTGPAGVKQTASLAAISQQSKVVELFWINNSGKLYHSQWKENNGRAIEYRGENAANEIAA
jgi:hypothetical protein